MRAEGYVSLADGWEPNAETAKAIMEYARDHLAPYLKVRRVEFYELPKTISGKIRRVELRRREEDRARRRHADRDRASLRGPGGPMKSYDAGPTDTPILEETIGANFERTVARIRTPRRSSTSPGARRWTYGELNDEIDVIARGLMALGVEPGERVGIWAPNCAEWTIVQYATAKIGAILVNINPAYRTHELAYVLNQSGVRTLISATAFKSSDYVGMVDEVRPECPRTAGGRLPGHRRLGGPENRRRYGDRGRAADQDGHAGQQ